MGDFHQGAGENPHSGEENPATQQDTERLPRPRGGVAIDHSPPVASRATAGGPPVWEIIS